MKTYHERSESITKKIKVLQKQRTKRRHIITTSCLLLAVVTLSLVLFVPFNTDPPDVSQYKDSPYYGLIQKINAATYKKPTYKNRFEKLTAVVEDRVVGNLGFKGEVVLKPGAPAEGAPMPDGVTGTNGNYVEVTDNQVEGVTEADIIKRTDKYIFYLREMTLTVYSIEGLDSKEVASFYLGASDDENAWWIGKREFYLSQDGKTVTVIGGINRYGVDGDKEKSESFVVALNLEFDSEAGTITETGRVYISGSQISSRMVGGKLLIMSNFRVWNNKDFSDEHSYLPQVGTEDSMESVPAENIVAPENLDDPRYTVITALDSKTLEVVDTAAFLSYSQELYVSRDNIFATRSYTEQLKNGDVIRQNMTEISCISYSDGKMEYKGSVKLPGNVKNQYSMDEYEGILRVVTSTNKTVQTQVGNSVGVRQIRNASLYCVSLGDFHVVAKVENFAPDNEQAESVRFDGKTAYVCTAEVITLTDPVYFFDLSDLNNITWKDTGTIDGYSSSLVNFGNGFLLGIGYGAGRNLKIEVYEEVGDKVVSVCAYELNASFLEEYKSYYIDREKGLIGLGVKDWDEWHNAYLLLHFDGYQLHELKKVITNTNYYMLRGLEIDGYLYVCGMELLVEKIG